jgi:hypothetical protein
MLALGQSFAIKASSQIEPHSPILPAASGLRRRLPGIFSGKPAANAADARASMCPFEADVSPYAQCL